MNASSCPPKVPAARSGLPKILYTEDDTELRLFSTRVLKRKGIEVMPVEDGLQAWEALDAEKFDLMIVNNEMPWITGLELVATADREGMDLLIIVASGSANILAMSSEGHCGRWGAAGKDRPALRFLPKPYSPCELARLVKEMLGLSTGEN